MFEAFKGKAQAVLYGKSGRPKG